MAFGIDIALAVNEFGIFDIALDADGDLQGTDSFNTALLMSLYCERRAGASEIADVSQRRGWWGNVLSRIPGFEIGSKFWLLNQARTTQNNLNYGITYLQDGFNWLVQQGYAKKVQVSGRIVNATGMNFTIQIFTGIDKVGTPLFDQWVNTGSSNINIEVF